jgi:membrane-bound lytic murein transglycosylase D
VRPAELADANQLAETASLEGKDGLIVPLAPELAPSTRMAWYTTRRGDTLVTIADRFGVSLAQLRRWNNMTGTKVEPGRRLHVAEPVVQAHGTSRRHHSGASGVRAGASGTQKSAAGGEKKPGEKTAGKKTTGTPAAKSAHRKTPAGAAHKRSRSTSNSSQK